MHPIATVELGAERDRLADTSGAARYRSGLPRINNKSADRIRSRRYSNRRTLTRRALLIVCLALVHDLATENGLCHLRIAVRFDVPGHEIAVEQAQIGEVAHLDRTHFVIVVTEER